MKFPKTLRSRLGDYIHNLRKVSGVTQAELAKACRCHVQFIVNVEAGKCLPTDRMLKGISSELGFGHVIRELILDEMNAYLFKTTK